MPGYAKNPLKYALVFREMLELGAKGKVEYAFDSEGEAMKWRMKFYAYCRALVGAAQTNATWAQLAELTNYVSARVEKRKSEWILIVARAAVVEVPPKRVGHVEIPFGENEFRPRAVSSGAEVRVLPMEESAFRRMAKASEELLLKNLGLAPVEPKVEAKPDGVERTAESLTLTSGGVTLEVPLSGRDPATLTPEEYHVLMREKSKGG